MSSTTAAADKENMAMKPSMSPSLLAAAATEAPRQKKAGVGKASASSSASASSKTATGKAGGKDKDRGKDGAAAAATTTTTATATTATKEKTHKLSLKGSSKLVCEFFEYSVNTILFQRGVYPPEDFSTVKKYGLNMLVSSDNEVKSYIKKFMKQLSEWMGKGKVSRLVIVITDRDDGEDVERWQFDVQVLGGGGDADGDGGGGDEKPGEKKKKKKKGATSTPAVGGDESAAAAAAAAATATPPAPQKTEKEIQTEIQALFRQITASVTFLPQLEGRCTFNVLVYADGDADVPMEWGDSDAREIRGGEKVALRSWGTASHRVDTLVSYRVGE